MTSVKQRGAAHRLLRILLMLLFASLALFGASTLVLLLRGGEPSDVHLRMELALFAVVAFSGAASGMAAVLARDRMRPLMVTGLITAAGAVLTWLFLAAYLVGTEREELALRCGVGLTVVTCVITQTGLLGLVRTRSTPLRVARGVMLAGSWSIALAIVMVAVSSQQFVQSIPEPVQMTIAIGVYGGTLTEILATGLYPMLVQHDALRRARRRDSLEDRIMLAMTCPICVSAGSFRTGAVRCRACGFAMMIEVEEPRCECGYALYQLTGETCPECGAVVPEPLRPSRA